MIICVHRRSIPKILSSYVEKCIGCSTSFGFDPDRYDACCVDALVSLIKYEIKCIKSEKIILRTLSGMLSYVITMIKSRQIFVEEMLTKNNPDTLHLSRVSCL
jgi:hypothetical protein